FDALDLAGLDRRMIALFRRRADEPPEDRRERRVGGRGVAVPPTAGPPARAPVGGARASRAPIFPPGGAQPRWLPPPQSAALSRRRHRPVGIHAGEGGLLVFAKRTADVDALVRQLKLADRPHHLLHVDRGVAPPDLDHGSPFAPS